MTHAADVLFLDVGGWAAPEHAAGGGRQFFVSGKWNRVSAA